MNYPNHKASFLDSLRQGALQGYGLARQVSRDKVQDERYEQERRHRQEREAVGDDRWERSFGLQQEGHKARLPLLAAQTEAAEYGLRRSRDQDRDNRLANLAMIHDGAEWGVEHFNQFGQAGGFDDIIQRGHGGAKLEGLSFSRFVPADEGGGYFAFMRTADGQEVPYSVGRGTDDDAAIFSADDIRGYMQQALAGSDRYAEHVLAQRNAQQEGRNPISVARGAALVSPDGTELYRNPWEGEGGGGAGAGGDDLPVATLNFLEKMAYRSVGWTETSGFSSPEGEKNYNAIFHRSASLVRAGVPPEEAQRIASGSVLNRASREEIQRIAEQEAAAAHPGFGRGKERKAYAAQRVEELTAEAQVAASEWERLQRELGVGQRYGLPTPDNREAPPVQQAPQRGLPEPGHRAEPDGTAAQPADAQGGVPMAPEQALGTVEQMLRDGSLDQRDIELFVQMYPEHVEALQALIESGVQATGEAPATVSPETLPPLQGEPFDLQQRSLSEQVAAGDQAIREGTQRGLRRLGRAAADFFDQGDVSYGIDAYLPGETPVLSGETQKLRAQGFLESVYGQRQPTREQVVEAVQNRDVLSADEQAHLDYWLQVYRSR